MKQVIIVVPNDNANLSSITGSFEILSRANEYWRNMWNKSKIFQIDMERTSQSPFFIFQAQKNHGDELVCQAQTYIEEKKPSEKFLKK